MVKKMSEINRLTIEAIVLLRQRIDHRIDAEVFRLSNGLYTNKDTVDELIGLIDESTYAEITRNEIVNNRK